MVQLLLDTEVLLSCETFIVLHPLLLKLIYVQKLISDTFGSDLCVTTDM